jgi:hypothetical protein
MMHTVVTRAWPAGAAISAPAHSTAPPLEYIEPAKAASDTGIAAVWRDALVTFCAQAPGILALASICFVGANAIGLAVSLALGLDRYVHATGPFATYSGIYETFAMDTRLFVVLVAQSLFGWLLVAFARGAITHLALHAASFGQACRDAWACMPALLVGTLIYSALIGFGAVGVNFWLRDHDAALNLSHVGQKPESVTLEGALRVTFIRGLNALIPDPGSPVAEFTPRLRHTGFRPPAQTSDDHQRLVAEKAAPSDESDEMQRIAVASLLALIVGDSLLRFRSVAAIQSASVLASLWRSVWRGVRHFIPITLHVWTLRLAVLLVNLVFIVYPVVVAQWLADPMPAWAGLPSSVVSLPLIVLAIALIHSVAAAFGAVYDARLYRALHPLASPIHTSSAINTDGETGRLARSSRSA